MELLLYVWVWLDGNLDLTWLQSDEWLITNAINIILTRDYVGEKLGF